MDRRAVGGYAIGSWASESLSESMFEMAVIRLSPLHCGFSYGETGRTERRSDIARFPGTCTDGISPTRSARAIWGGGRIPAPDWWKATPKAGHRKGVQIRAHAPPLKGKRPLANVPVRGRGTTHRSDKNPADPSAASQVRRITASPIDFMSP